MLARMQRNWIIHTLFVGMFNGTAIEQPLENTLAVFVLYKTCEQKECAVINH